MRKAAVRRRGGVARGELGTSGERKLCGATRALRHGPCETDDPVGRNLGRRLAEWAHDLWADLGREPLDEPLDRLGALSVSTGQARALRAGLKIKCLFKPTIVRYGLWRIS